MLGLALGIAAVTLAFGCGAGMWWAVAVAFKPASRLIASLPGPASGGVALTLLVLCILVAIRIVATAWHLLGRGILRLVERTDGRRLKPTGKPCSSGASLRRSI
jgi:hypothetical protein